ncbi:MAG: hypothetical protein ACRCT7_09845 [Shewanella sp.]
MLEWIEEELRIIESNPFNPINTNEIRNTKYEIRNNLTSLLIAFQTTLPKQEIGQHELDAFREELESMLGFDLDIDNAQLYEFIDEPAKF